MPLPGAEHCFDRTPRQCRVEVVFTGTVARDSCPCGSFVVTVRDVEHVCQLGRAGREDLGLPSLLEECACGAERCCGRVRMAGGELDRRSRACAGVGNGQNERELCECCFRTGNICAGNVEVLTHRLEGTDPNQNVPIDPAACI